ncbi:hypothetical protein SAMN05421504_104513 [Amycolatopsis xylanica]|uniref:Excreted virulence factor EspC, type VII ESX diderm n=1 Tax=Amycolatopsis xylanica TaxID=589385 RepID=A0A1H3H6P5_9PSEU|nr:hypothetical protein [Amycolatopsis xylanica]SDY10309.1 hypothetical protein SAMN05421504_104513 [Amycolatopsis xylanica]
MTRRFDPEQIAALAGKVGGLKDALSKAGKDLGDGNPGTAYGSLSNAANAGKTTQGFYSGVNAELAAASKLVTAASEALAYAAKLQQGNEDDGVDTFKAGNRKRD